MELYLGILFTFSLLTMVGLTILLVIQFAHRQKVAKNKLRTRSEKFFKWLVLLVFFSGFIYLSPYVLLLVTDLFLGDIFVSNSIYLGFLFCFILLGWVIYLFRKEVKLVNKAPGLDKTRVYLAFYSNVAMSILAIEILFFFFMLINFSVNSSDPTGMHESF